MDNGKSKIKKIIVHRKTITVHACASHQIQNIYKFLVSNYQGLVKMPYFELGGSHYDRQLSTRSC